MVCHDLGAACRLCERTLVMEAGRVVEDVATSQLLNAQATEPPGRCWTRSRPPPM